MRRFNSHFLLNFLPSFVLGTDENFSYPLKTIPSWCMLVEVFISLWWCLSLLIFPCTIKSRSSLLAPAHPGGPGKRAIKRLWWCGDGEMTLTLLVGRQEEHLACKNWVLRCWHGYVWSDVQMVYIWSSWCNFHPIISHFIKIQIGLTFLVPTYPGCLNKRPLNGCVFVCFWWCNDVTCRLGGHHPVFSRGCARDVW